jgi:phage terminase large subunit
MMMAANQQKLDRYIKEARVAGCPDDQLRNFRAGNYCPLPRALEFHAAARAADKPDGPSMIGLGGARGGGKSHATSCQMVLDDCVRYPGIKFLFLRSVGKSARESFEDLLDKALPHLRQYYQPSRLRLALPAGSLVVLGGFRTESDINKYIGIEYDGVALEEANLLTSRKVEELFGSVRSSKPGWRVRKYLTFNPGGVGHAWIKQRFIKPWRDGTETDTRFIFSTVDDNPFISEDYVKYLDSLTGWLKRAWRYGDWDISAGQFFTTWRDDIHVEEFDVVHGRRFWMSLDYGFTHYTVATLACEHDGDIDVVDSHAERRWLVKSHADAIKAMLARHGLSLDKLDDFVAGPDVWAQRGTELTVAQQYEQEGIYFSRANTDRIAGAAEILALLGDTEAGIRSRLRVHPRCGRLRECLPAMQHDPHRPEDVLKVNCDEDGLGGDDDYDSFRYLVMARTQGGITVIPNPLAGYRG